MHTVTEYTCQTCDYKITDAELLATHVSFSHKVLKFECKNVFNNEKDMDEHKKLHVESQGVTYLCDLCTFESSTAKGV